MKARKRVVTSPRPTKRPKRTPTIRKIKSAIVPVDRSVIRPAPPTRVVAARSEAAPLAASVPGSATSPAPGLDLSVDLGRGLVLRNPLIAASGPFGYGVEVAGELDLAAIGALVTRSTTLRPSHGQTTVGPRIVEVPGGIVSGVGFPSPGIDAVLERFAPTWARWPTPVILSLLGDSAGDVVEMLKRLEAEPGIAGIELNLRDAATAARVADAARRATDLALIAKLPPDSGSLRSLARSVVDAGADALAAIGGVPAFALAADRSSPAFGSNGGLLSGPAVRPVALGVVFELAQASDVPVIGTGGVGTLDDVLDFLAAGAGAVGVGTAALAEPDLPARLATQLSAYCAERGTATVAELVGTAKIRARRRAR
jgi:dihydroorotate dehydrogenase (NAD+) catalytic subunit